MVLGTLTLILLILAAVVAWLVISGKLLKKSTSEGTVTPADKLSSDAEVLIYRVPEGQDPAVVLAELERDGFEAAPEMIDGKSYVEVQCPGGRDATRAEVRAAIARADTSAFSEAGAEVRGPVVFEDEAR